MVWQLTNQDGYVTHNVLQISTTGQLDFWCTWGQIGFWNWTNLDFGYLLLLCSYFKSTTKHLVSAKIMLLVSEGVVISPPLSSLTLYGGDITPFLEHYGEGGGFPPRGWYPPLVLIWPWATGAVSIIKLSNFEGTKSTWVCSLLIWVKLIFSESWEIEFEVNKFTITLELSVCS